MSKKAVVQKGNATILSEEELKASYKLEERLCYILLGALILLVILIRSKFLNIPFERDEGAYSYYGKLLTEGKIPYKDFYEQKFPGIFYFYALIVSIFGDTVKAMHTGFIFINIATITLLFFSAKKLFSPIAGLIAATTFAITSLTPILSGFTIQSEHGVALFTSVGIFLYAMINTTRKSYYYFLMGLAMGMAFMVKTSGMFMLAWGGLFLLIDFFFLPEKNYRKLIVNLLLYGAGAFLIIALLFLIIYLKGAFSDMIFWSYEIPKNYVGKIPFKDGVTYFKYTRDAILQDYKFFWFQVILALGLLFFKNVPLKMKLFALTLSLFAFMMIVPGFYFYGHYWIQLLPALAIVAGFVFSGLNDVLRSRFKITSPRLKYIYLGIFLLFTLSNLAINRNYYFHPNYYRIMRTVYGSNPFPETMEIAKYITANSKPEDKVIAMGSEPEIYFYTKKNCPSRHAYFAAIVDNVPQHHQWQREYTADIEKAKPRYFVFYNHAISLFVQPNTDRYVFDWANKYVGENYRLVGLADMIEGGQTQYIWNEQLNNYKPVSQNVIYVYERKN